MKVLVTGANGLLGHEFTSLLQNPHVIGGARYEGSEDLELTAMTHQDLDITDSRAVNDLISYLRPEVIINAAAYTSVDGAEANVDTAYAVNADGARILAAAANDVGAKLCHFSTDYVFDGDHNTPYEPTDATNPQTVYGQSKLLGEDYVRNFNANHLIVRTAWLYGAHGPNFVHTMLQLAADPNVSNVRVVNDQTGSPTWARDVAKTALELIGSEYHGTFHVTNSGCTTWYGLAQELFRMTAIQKALLPVSTSEFPRPAQRPRYSVLGLSALEKAGFAPLRHWTRALKAYIHHTQGAEWNESDR